MAWDEPTQLAHYCPSCCGEEQGRSIGPLLIVRHGREVVSPPRGQHFFTAETSRPTSCKSSKPGANDQSALHTTTCRATPTARQFCFPMDCLMVLLRTVAHMEQASRDPCLASTSRGRRGIITDPRTSVLLNAASKRRTFRPSTGQTTEANVKLRIVEHSKAAKSPAAKR